MIDGHPATAAVTSTSLHEPSASLGIVPSGGVTSAGRLRQFSAPSVQVSDMQYQARDNVLVISTYGRGIWVMDDITRLESLFLREESDMHELVSMK